MANIDYSFENSIPIGPLKIAALDSCKDFAKKVDDYIVSFRQHDAEALAQRQSMLDFRGYTPNEIARMSRPEASSRVMPSMVPMGSMASTPSFIPSNAATKKIYPNDPCPCGSGKKYKKCCGRK